MAGTCIHLMLAVLCFSIFVCKNGAIPFTRSRNLMQRSLGNESGNWGNKAERNLEGTSLVKRIEFELNDYPGSGANNRHTPRPQPGRGCLVC